MIALPATVHRTDDLAADLPAVVGRFGTRPIVVTDTTIAAAGVAVPVAHCLGADVVAVLPGEPIAATVAELAVDVAEADVVVAVGGGSVLDSAKLAARLVRDPGGLADRLRSAVPFPPGLPVVALPTTSGSGAEVTRTAIVSHDGRKTWAWDERLRPEAAVLAPVLTDAVPPAVSRAAGLDAFVHAVEAATGRRRTPEMTALGFEAAAVIVESLAPALAGDRSARTRMMEASTAAGVAIDHCGTGIGHAVGHALASVVAIPHGLAVMLGWYAGLQWSLSQAGEIHAGLAHVLGTSLDGLEGRIDRFVADVGLAEALAVWTPPSADALSAEMLSEDHRPMRENSARPVMDADIGEVVGLTLERWSA